MEDDAPVIYGLGDFQARAIASQVAETEAIRFLVGTQSLRHDNQIHQIDFDDESNLINKNVFLHRDGEIWHISSSPLDKNILATCYNQTSEARAEMRASLWRIPADFNSQVPDDNGASQNLELLAHFTQEEGDDMKGILWHPSGESSQVIALSENHIQLCDLEESGENISVTSSTALEGRGHPKFTCASWNPHHNSTQIATANDTCIRGWDLRTMKQSYLIENAHGQLVRDVDFNPNKQYYLASCGDDCRAKFWDIRNTTEPVKILSDHSHWVWCVRYNNFHDQLVLTSSSDARVILTNVASISSEPFGHLVDEEGLDEGDDEEQRTRSSEPISDGVISTYEEHEDSVYATAWSTTDPWLFASLSFDGRLVINRVPKKTKYRILL